MNKNKIVFVNICMARGGTEKVASLLSKYFDEKNWEVYIIVIFNNNVGYKLNKNVKIIDLTFGLGSRYVKLIKWIKFLRKTIKEIAPDIILSFSVRVGLLTQLACFNLNKRIIISERNDPFMDGRSKFIDLLTNYFYPKTKALVFQTKHALEYFKKLNLQNSFIIPNPINITCEKKNEIENKIVSVGRLDKQKNHAMLINSFSKIVNIFQNATLYIYGDGILKDELQQQINQLNLTNKVFLKGNTENIHQKISDAALFVLSSNYEGLSNALLEAMAMGLPCVSTKVAGADEYIKNGFNGLLTDVGDEKQMIEAIDYMLKNRQKALEMGINARRSVQSLTNNKILELWYEVISNSIKS